MRLFSIIFALLAMLNTVDVHALSHLLDGDDHLTIENCENCENYLLQSEDEVFVLPPCIHLDFSLATIEKSSITIYCYQKSTSYSLLGKYFNKPPPFTI